MDINQLNSPVGQNIVNNNLVSSSFAPIGWMYLDNNGGYWFQADPQSKWSVSFSVELSKRFGLNVTPPTWQIPTYIPNGRAGADALVANKDAQVIPCFEQGKTLT